VPVEVAANDHSSAGYLHAMQHSPYGGRRQACAGAPERTIRTPPVAETRLSRDVSPCEPPPDRGGRRVRRDDNAAESAGPETDAFSVGLLNRAHCPFRGETSFPDLGKYC